MTFRLTTYKFHFMKSYKRHQDNNRQITKICTFILILITAFVSKPVLAQQTSFFKSSQTNPLKNNTVPSNRESHPFFIDIDGDKDLDCFSGEYTNGQISKIYYYRNDGTNKNPVFKAVSGLGNPLEEVEANLLSIPYFIDIDNDGDYDCFIGEGSTGAIVYYKNTGSATHPSFQKQSAAFNPLSMVKFSASDVANPAFADIDSDGDFDCLVADEAGNVNFFKNTGTATNPVFEHITDAENPFNFLSSEKSIYNVSFEDWNKDGLVDLFINTNYYKNTGTKQKAQFNSGKNNAPVFEITAANMFAYTPLRWVDLNNDGEDEVFQGNSKGTFVYQTMRSDISKDALVSNSQISINVLPNPSTTEFTLRVLPAAVSVVRVADVQGKLMLTQIVNNSTIRFGKELKPGIYFLQIMQNNKVISNQKIIKQ